MTTSIPILIVEGNPAMADLLQRFFAFYQVMARTALSPAEALSMLAQQSFREVITDAFTPPETGIALIRTICHAFPATHVILMTAFGTPELCRIALAAGASACVIKPFRLQELWDLVQPVLQGLSPPLQPGVDNRGEERSLRATDQRGL